MTAHGIRHNLDIKMVPWRTGNGISMVDVQTPVATLHIEPALALLEFSSIAAGVYAGDAMVKRAQLDVVHAGTVHPGRFLVLVGGSVAEVEEALKAGQENALDSLNDHIFLPGVHPDVVKALAGGRAAQIGDALGIVETQTVPAAILAADKGVKVAEVSLMEIRLADGLNGKGLVFFSGLVSDVEAAVELSTGSLQKEQLVKQIVIAKLHAEMATLVQNNTRFGVQLGWNFRE
jgi:bacterial microcompartment shell protein